VEEIHYYPYGETLSDTGSVSVKHKFTSQELDSETGLYHYGARCYDPALGRFTTADSIVPDPTNPQSLNRYSYVQNNPIKYTDPSGHGWFKKLRRAFRRVFKQARRVVRAVKKVYSKPVFRIASAVVVGAVTGGASFAVLGGEGLFAYAGATIIGGGSGYLTYASSGYSEGGGGSRSSGIINAGSSASLAPIGTLYYPLPEGYDPEDIDATDLMPGLGGAAGKGYKFAKNAKRWSKLKYLLWKVGVWKGTPITKKSVIKGYKVSNHAWRKSGLGRGATEELVVDIIQGAKKAGTVITEAGTGKHAGNIINKYQHNDITVVIDETNKTIMLIRPLKGFYLP